MATVNRQITLASRPVGFPRVSNFDLVYSPLPSLAAGEVLVRELYLSLDPWMRGRMNAAGPSSMAIGDLMIGGAVALVMASEDPQFVAGDAVEGLLGWQEYAVVQGRELRKLDATSAPLSTALGVLGTPGLTAYFGLFDICRPEPGETVVVSGATGAVGMVAGQLAKIAGCRVVGVAGSDAETSWLRDELGFDAAFNHRAGSDLRGTLETLCPAGIDVYFDNVGGAITDAVIERINDRARICVCGQSSQSNLEQPEMAPRWLDQLRVKQASARGFLVASYRQRFPEACERLREWLRQGKLQYREDIAQGIEAAPQAFIAMLRGKSQGKQLVQLSEYKPTDRGGSKSPMTRTEGASA